MKKLLLGLVLSLSISTVLACHIDPIGECDGNSYFITRIFNPNSVYHFIAAGDTIETFTTGSVVQDSVFSLPIPAGTEILMAYNYAGSDFIEYSSSTSADYQFAGCGALAVQFSNISAQRDGENVTVNFTNYDESEVLRYDIMVSKNSKDWVQWQSVQPAGQQSYSINLASKRVIVIAAFVLPFIFFVNKKSQRKARFKFLAYMLILMAVVLFSCTKETDSIAPFKLSDYSLVKINAVKVDGSIVSSEIKGL